MGIPRVLNMYENYPFWHTFFTELGFRVILTPASTRKMHELGIESIPSESECYPARTCTWTCPVADQPEGVTHHLLSVASLTSVMEFADANNHYNCPIVTSYAENIKNNVDAIVTSGEVDVSCIRSCPLPSVETLSSAVLTEEFGTRILRFPADRDQSRCAASAGWLKSLPDLPGGYDAKRARKLIDIPERDR